MHRTHALIELAVAALSAAALGFASSCSEPLAGPGDPSLPGDVPACTTPIDLAALKSPGAAAGIIKHGELACVSVAGYANIEQDRAVTPETAFAWASVSKTVTATATMILVDEGLLTLDDDVNEHLPFSVRNPSCADAPVTVRQLLTHSSSLVDNDDVYYESYSTGDSPVALGAFVRDYFAADGALYDADENFDAACPGEVTQYSNVAVGLLGYVVEVVAGQPFDAFCDERIFAPLGIGASTAWRLADLDEENVAMPYELAVGGFDAQGHIGFPTYPDGGLRSSVPELARFLAMFAGGGAPILSASAVQQMRAVQDAALDDTQGLIWYYDDYGAREDLLGHDGSDPGTSAMMFFDPDDAAAAGVLLVVNGNWYDANDDSPEADALMGALFAEADDYE